MFANASRKQDLPGDVWAQFDSNVSVIVAGKVVIQHPSTVLCIVCAAILIAYGEFFIRLFPEDVSLEGISVFQALARTVHGSAYRVKLTHWVSSVLRKVEAVVVVVWGGGVNKGKETNWVFSVSITGKGVGDAIQQQIMIKKTVNRALNSPRIPA